MGRLKHCYDVTAGAEDRRHGHTKLATYSHMMAKT